jgi:hypothetical protein
MKITYSVFILFLMLFNSSTASAGNWRGLIIAKENRCSEYDKKRDYPYSQSVEDEIITLMRGQIYGPYTGRTFASGSISTFGSHFCMPPTKCRNL